MTISQFIGDGPSGAIFDESRNYRYCLWRRFEDSCLPCQMVGFVGLNGSKADENDNDRTINRLIGFAKLWGFRGMAMFNAFGWMDTYPDEMKKAADPVGPLNDAALLYASKTVKRLVCCWGAEAIHRNRAPIVRHILASTGRELWCFGLTKHGHPVHPLYQRADTPLILWK